MMRLCLTKEEYHQFIQNEFHGRGYDSGFKNLAGWVGESKDYFDIELVGYNYFLSKNFEVYMKGGIDCQQILNFIYSIENKMLFRIEEFDHSFVEKLMVNHMPDGGGNLDEDLLQVTVV